MKRSAASAVLMLALASCSVPTSGVAPGEGPAASSDPGSSSSADSKTASFKDKVTYPDGLEVEVTTVSSKKTGRFAALDTGKTAKAGTKYSLLKVRVRNGSKEKVDLLGSGAMTYGPDGDAAPQVFDGDVGKQITGSVLPGKAKTGTYGYVVPAKYLGDATLEFTPDGVHEAAVFSGSLK